MKIIVIVSADAEWEGVKPLFPDVAFRNTPFGETADVVLGSWNLTLFHSGWGKIASAASSVHPPEKTAARRRHPCSAGASRR